MKIAFYDTHKYDKESFSHANCEYNFDIEYFDFRLSDKTASTAKGFDAVCVFVNDKLDKKCLEILAENKISIVILRCSGFNNVDLKTALKLNIRIVRVPGYSPAAIAEHTFALLLSLTRKIPQAYIKTKNGNFTLDGLTGRNLCGLTMGVIGTGKIGKNVCKIAKGFGMDILAYDNYLDMSWANSNGVEYSTLKNLFQNSDVISLHCPLTEQTKYIINEHSISQMKNDAIIINTGRGGLIETSALVKALKENKIAGAALDVYEEEEKYFFNDWSENVIGDDILIRLLTFPNVIVTSHQAFLTKEALWEIAKISLDNAYKLSNHEICHNCING